MIPFSLSALCIKGPFIHYIRKIFRKTNISNPLIRTHTCAYQGVTNVSFSENFACVLNKWCLMTTKRFLFFRAWKPPFFLFVHENHPFCKNYSWCSYWKVYAFLSIYRNCCHGRALRDLIVKLIGLTCLIRI